DREISAARSLLGPHEWIALDVDPAVPGACVAVAPGHGHVDLVAVASDLEHGERPAHRVDGPDLAKDSLEIGLGQAVHLDVPVPDRAPHQVVADAASDEDGLGAM